MLLLLLIGNIIHVFVGMDHIIVITWPWMGIPIRRVWCKLYLRVEKLRSMVDCAVVNSDCR